ncbi:MAG TPA: hypothetical protein VMU81_24605 [Acetobacteraceae bacterium]|jgi:hypothetical protein|nr:hypothetical protein [Acetobacteraceae bacterium]
MTELKDRLFDVAKGAVQLNLRYAATAVNLATNYISELGGMLRETGQTGGVTGAPPAPRRPPILLVGQLNDTPSGAFALSNSSDRELSVTLVAQGELDPGLIEVMPASLRLAPGASAFVRLKVLITEALTVEHDYGVAVLAPGLAAPAVDFVVRRLPASA